MLTPAQYKALKAWSDSVSVIWSSQGLSTILKTNICDLSTFYALLDAGFILIPRLDCIRKRQPACDEAIREYEAAQRIDNHCVGCGSQRCYPAYCDSLKEYEAKKISG